MNFLWWGNKGGKDEEKKQDLPEKPAKAEQPAPTQSPLHEELQGLRKKLDVQEGVRDELRDNRGKALWEAIFGAGAVSTLLGEVHSWIWGKKEIDWKEFEAEMARAIGRAGNETFDIEEYIVAHRALGYGRHKENSIEAVRAALDSGERQIEIDLRKDSSGEIYLAHSDISGIDGKAQQLTPLDEALEVFAGHEKRQDAVAFFDIKEQGILDELDKKIEAIDLRHKAKPGYQPLAERHFVVSFNDEILSRAKDKNRQRPAMYCYIPSKKVADITGMLGLLGYRGASMITKAIDSLTGTRMSDDLARTRVRLNGEDIGDSSGRPDSLSLYDELPPDNILEKVDYICIPASLATRELVEKAHDKGVKVAVWGPTAKGVKIQEAFAELNVDLVVSDQADVIANTEEPTQRDISDDNHNTGNDGQASPQNPIV